MTLETYKPSDNLRPFVSSISFLQGDGTGAAFQRVYQTIIINLETNFSVSPLYDAKAVPVENKSVIWINGKQDIPIMIENKGITKMYVVGVNSGMLPYLTDLPAYKTNNKAVSAEHWASPDIFALRGQLLTCSVREGFTLIEKYFTSLILKKDISSLDKILWLNKAINTHTVGDICQALGMTRKKLREDALHLYGASVKNLQGMIRFNKTLSVISHNAQEMLSSIHSFYDQSHFIKDFKIRTGMTPIQYKKLCQRFPFIKHTPNFIALQKETFLQFISIHNE
jgi:AraC-like DNA-binding protein